MTGIGGFVGQNLAATLRRAGHEIIGLSREKSASATLTWVDVSAGTLPPFDAVIHLAGYAHDLKHRARAQVYFDVNTELTKQIFGAFQAEASARLFFFFSSVKAVADFVPASEELMEEVVPAPAGPYGESKRAAEKFLQENFDFGGNDGASGRRLYILRPCMIHGCGNKGNLNLLYAVVRRNLPWIFGAFENRRSFLSMENCAFIVEKMLAGTPPSGVYNLADDDPLSTNTLVETMTAAMGRKRMRVVKFPAGILRFCASAGTLFHLPFNRERLTKLTESYVVSNAKIRRALGFEKLPVPVREGIAETVKSLAGSSRGKKVEKIAR